ncbi:D-2-hydroxyacid dehydrogenase [Bacillus chungangensis]|uniref:Phosphoglycerate dehydrogenase-like enzyme n=1 Tax=Bacillus chungangensis TaxID=587633 RepID=A0ABT9WQZ6_9BACI|nr:D-2-hydroxyacid dehydrogenase [Bacillus chungangensis]MDQ0175718.1 phosphoglycerate dehydrogenase-like enzyme [Bacillus chungangensis]
MQVLLTLNPPPFLKEDMHATFPQIYFHYEKLSAAENILPHAEIIVTYGEDLTVEHLEKAKRLKWIMVASAGLEKMPLAQIAERNILVTNARGIHKIPMAEFTIGLLLQHMKQFPVIWQQERENIWNKRVPMGELYGKTIMVVGAGAIGSEIAKLSKAFSMTTIGVNASGNSVAYFDQMLRADEIAEGLKRTDFVVSVLPSTEKTQHFFQKEHFIAMKESAVFINIGRGDVVQESVLIDALKKEEIAHAYLDVFQTEPLPADHPFWSMNNLTVTPHISSKSKQYLPRVFDIWKHNLHTYIRNGNDYLNVIDLKRGY